MSCWSARQYLGWEVLEAKSESLTVRVLPAVGGRVQSLVFEGRELLYQNTRHLGCVARLGQDADWRVEKKRVGFPLWGGSKVWLAPQEEWGMEMPHLDLDSGAYAVEVLGNELRLRSPVCRESGIRVHRLIWLEGESLRLVDTIENAGSSPVKKGLWEVSMFWRPMLVFSPEGKAEWRPYPQEGQSVALFDSVVSEGTEISCSGNGHFKVGCASRSGVLLGVSGPVAIRRHFEPLKGELAHGANLEIYNSPDHHYLELEAHGEFGVLEPGERRSLPQSWHLQRVED